MLREYPRLVNSAEGICFVTRMLVIDTAGRQVRIEAVESQQLIASHRPASAHHVRTLTGEIRRLLRQLDWELASVSILGVNIGPGTFTGIRVGLAIAKALCYAQKKQLVGVDMFDGYGLGLALAGQWPAEVSMADVLLEGQLQSVSAVRFTRTEQGISRGAIETYPHTEIPIRCQTNVAVTGMLDRLVRFLPVGIQTIGQVPWDETRPSITPIVIDRARANRFDDPWIIEPCYVRPSSAEEKWEPRSS